MAKKSKRGPGRASRPGGGRYTPPAAGGAASSDFAGLPGMLPGGIDDGLSDLLAGGPDPLDEPWGPIDVNFKGAGSMTLPSSFVFWLADGGGDLGRTFSDTLLEWQEAQRHGDIITFFAEEHGAPAEVIEAIPRFVAYMDERYGG